MLAVTELSTRALADSTPGLADLALGQDTIVVRHYGPPTLTLRRGRRPKESSHLRC